MVTGYLFAQPLETISLQKWLQNIIVMAVMFLMALPLPLSTIVETVRQPWPTLLATALNFGLFPIVAVTVSPLIDPAMRAGFLVIAATPCTLASAAVWTRRAGGNDVTALMTTVITNATSFVMTPLIVFLLIRQSAEVSFGEMVWKLGLLVLLPMLLAQLLAARKPIGAWAGKCKKPLNVGAQSGILMIVLLGTAQTVLKLSPDQTPNLATGVGLILVCALLHTIVLGAGLAISRWFDCPWPDQIAVAFAGSQKTLMIGLLVCIQLGVSLVPMVVYHAVQLLIDTLVADGLQGRAGRRESS